MMRLSITITATLMLALAGFPASGQTDEQIRDYLTNDECYWPDFQRNPSFKICPPEDMVRATGGRDGPGWIVTPSWINGQPEPYPQSYRSEVPGLTVMYSCHVNGTVHYSYGLCGFVSFRVERNPEMATKGEQTHGYGYNLEYLSGIPIWRYGRRPHLVIDRAFLYRLYKHEVLAIVDAAFKAFGVSGGNHGIECTNPSYDSEAFEGADEILLLWPDAHVGSRATWDGNRKPFGYQPEFRIRSRVESADEPCNLAFRASP